VEGQKRSREEGKGGMQVDGRCGRIWEGRPGCRKGRYRWEVPRVCAHIKKARTSTLKKKAKVKGTVTGISRMYEYTSGRRSSSQAAPRLQLARPGLRCTDPHVEGRSVPRVRLDGGYDGRRDFLSREQGWVSPVPGVPTVRQVRTDYGMGTPQVSRIAESEDSDNSHG